MGKLTTMLRSAIVLGVCWSFTFCPARAAEKEAPTVRSLPKPLEAIAYDFGVLEKHFKVVECKFYPADEFTVDGRVVAEATIVWSLEAKDTMKGSEIYDVFHPNPAPSPFLRIRAFKLMNAKEVSAAARPQGYALIRDGRWISRKAAPDLAKGEKLSVWVHLGSGGSASLIEQGVVKLAVSVK
jgi:hypothetical protein